MSELLKEWVKETGAVAYGSSWYCEIEAIIEKEVSAALAATPAVDAQPLEFLPFSARLAIANSHGMKVTSEFNALVRAVIAEYRARAVPFDFAAAPVVMPEPVTDAQINSAFLANGFTIKEGLTDLKPYVYQAARALLAGVSAPAAVEQHPDDAAVDALAELMKAKLAKQRAKGYSGWNTVECTQQRLSDMLRGHVDKGDPVDVANFCAFLSARGEGIAPQPQSDARDVLPMQPIVRAADGVNRFRENRIVSALLDGSEKNGYGLNEIALGDFTDEERMQFAQLIGYSVSGYGNLSYVSEESVARADELVDAISSAQAAAQGGE